MLYTGKRKSHLAVQMLCEGGGIDFGMLPILLFAVRWGVGPGLVVGFADGVLQFMQAGGIAIGWQSIIGDYLVAFTMLGLVVFGLLSGPLGKYFRAEDIRPIKTGIR